MYLTITSPIHLELIRIPAGEFFMGSDAAVDTDAADEEMPQHRVNLPEFYIGKYPVTVAQFSVCPEAFRFGWGIDIDTLFLPVTQVSWFEARAFCGWLSAMTGHAFNLPSEAQWEKAARGSDGRVYPWGGEGPNERLCNFNSRSTTRVGQYPDGASPYGLLDMAGNVWEWTSSLWGARLDKLTFGYPYDATDGREDLIASDRVLRVLRGGAFDDGAGSVRCAVRERSDPHFQLGDFGFRVMASPVPW